MSWPLSMRESHVAVVVVAVLLGGCALSRSSSESSLSLASSSLSSSSSAAVTASQAYRDDVMVATATFVESGRIEAAAFQRELGRIASAHGVTDWEELEAVYRAIGAGLRLGSVDANDARDFAVRTFETRPDAVALILAGHRDPSTP